MTVKDIQRPKKGFSASSSHVNHFDTSDTLLDHTDMPTEPIWSSEPIDIAALERQFQRNIDKTQRRGDSMNDEETIRANLEQMLLQLFPDIQDDDAAANTTDDSYNVTNDDDFLDTASLVRDKPRDPKLSQLPSPKDTTRSSVWTANERLVNPKSPHCNCTTHMDGRGLCCSRVFRRPHKMVRHGVTCQVSIHCRATAPFTSFVVGACFAGKQCHQATPSLAWW